MVSTTGANQRWSFLKDMHNYKELMDALDVISAHTFSEIPLTREQRELAEATGKPIWNTEDHIYRKGFDALISIVKAFNDNYIISGATRVVNWYDIAGVYPLQPYGSDPSMLIANEPWSGNYVVREALWGYAHYGQFTKIGWQYVDEGCVNLKGGGTMVTLKNPVTGDYSVIFETKDVESPQNVKVKISDGLSTKNLCVWYSEEKEQFVRMNDITPKNGIYSITLNPNTVYSLSTTRGQQKGSFANIPKSEPFPIPYEDDFDSYTHPAQWGYLPHYTADIIGCFELTQRPEQNGQCIRQTVGEHTLSWAPEWHHYSILGDENWTDYEISADVYLNPKDEAAVMGRVCDVGSGYGVWAKGYYLKLDDNGNCSLVITRGKFDPKELIGDAEQQAIILARDDTDAGGEFTLASAKVEGINACKWYNLKLRFEGDELIGFVDGKEVVKARSDQYPRGMAGLLAPLQENRVCTPYFDNLKIVPLGRTQATKKRLKPDVIPIYQTLERTIE